MIIRLNIHSNLRYLILLQFLLLIFITAIKFIIFTVLVLEKLKQWF